MKRTPLVLAAGCVLWRPATAVPGIEVAVIHRPVHDDWSLPKGKLEPGETARECAVRETREETGAKCRLGPELPARRYRDRRDRPKEVRYWAARATGGGFTPNREVDILRWLPPAEAAAALTHPHDVPLIDALLGVWKDGG